MGILDSGERTVFGTSAVRDCHEGKGRMDLTPLGIVGAIMGDSILVNIDLYMNTGRKEHLVAAIKEFAGKYYPDIHTAIIEVSKHYEEGCKKYGERNWQKGIPLHCYIDSATRHYMKHLRGDKDEPHDRAFMWNILGAIWTHANLIEQNPELNDLPWKGNGADVQDNRSTGIFETAEGN